MYTSAFFNSKDGDRRYRAEDFAEFFAAFIGNGVFLNPSNSLQVIFNNGMQVKILPGKAWINGYIFNNKGTEFVTLDYADSALSRIDQIVLRWSLRDRNITLQVKKGRLSASQPQLDALERNAEVFELTLASIRVSKGVPAITPADITDQRLNTAVCGVVKGTVEEIDTTTLFNKFESWYNSFTAQESNNFHNWFNSVRDIMDEHIAQKLTARIDALDAGKADKAHKHNAGDITSGILSIARGGTGGVTAETARNNLGVLPAVQGIWTPTVLDGNPTYERNVGSYLKVGRMVTVTFSVRFKPREATVRIFITGLPFMSDATVGQSAGGFKLNCPKLATKFVPNGVLMFPDSDTCGIYVLDTTAPERTQSPAMTAGETYEVNGSFSYFSKS